MTYAVDELPYAFGVPEVTGQLKSSPEDFVVEEIPGFEPEGSGSHAYLVVQKKNLTTPQVAKQLQRFCNVHPRDIGFAGMKDKQAVTTQTFSVDLKGQADPDWSNLVSEQLQVLSVTRHKRKLKRGVLKGNRFSIVLRHLSGDMEALDLALTNIDLHGAPNYFGSQRFGHGGANIERAEQLFNGELVKINKDERSILLSSVRSMIFNAVLAERVKQDNWYQLLEGDVINLDGTQRHFAETIDDVLIKRAQDMDVHPTGPLAGLASRALEPTGPALDIENSILSGYSEWIKGLEKQKLDHARRPLRVSVRKMNWQTEADQLQISFELTSGAYATSVLRECIKTHS